LKTSNSSTSSIQFVLTAADLDTMYSHSKNFSAHFARLNTDFSPYI